MKHIYTAALCLVFAVSTASANTYGQFFNNNNPTFIDSQASLYNWFSATANNITTVSNDISAGNTSPSALPGEETLGRGFFFLLPQNSAEGAGATFMYTTNTVSTTVQQNNPQPDWYRDSPSGALTGATLSDVTNILFRANSGASNSYQSRIGIQVGGNWYLSSSAFTLTTSFTEFNLPNLAAETWIEGAFVGGNLDADVSDNTTTLLAPGDVVTGYGMYADVEAVVGSNSRIRMDRMVVTAVPEPSSYALIGGVLALGLVMLRRRL